MKRTKKKRIRRRTKRERERDSERKQKTIYRSKLSAYCENRKNEKQTIRIQKNEETMVK